MIDIQLKDCCHTCSNIDVDYEQTRGFGEVVTVIGCKHACVCGLYKLGEESTPEDVIIKGFADADP